MKFRIGLILGFATGYYLGTKAGQERYEQLRRLLDRVEPVAKMHAVVDLGRERLRGAAETTPGEMVVPPSSN
jgi:DNA-binding transcriptional LysR family regulator